jgi:hypothetical protein
MKRIASLLIACAPLGACSGGPSDGEFVQACLAQRNQMVRMTEDTCKGAASYARENLDAKLRQMLLLDMQGRKQEVEALADGMSFEDRGRFAMKQIEMVGRCVADIGPGR